MCRTVRTYRQSVADDPHNMSLGSRHTGTMHRQPRWRSVYTPSIGVADRLERYQSCLSAVRPHQAVKRLGTNVLLTLSAKHVGWNERGQKEHRFRVISEPSMPVSTRECEDDENETEASALRSDDTVEVGEAEAIDIVSWTRG